MHLSDIQARLKQIGNFADQDVPLVETLLLLGALDRDGVDLTPYVDHLHEMEQAINALPEQNPAQALNEIIAHQFGYQDEGDAGDPVETNFLDIMDRRSGNSIGLGALYIQLAQSQGWQAKGINFPGHFLFRIDQGVQHLIVDPFHADAPLDAGKLRQLLKLKLGERAELNHNYYEPVSTRDVILRFCNTRKTALIAKSDYIRALQVVTHELWIAPQEPKLYFDAGVISIKLGHLEQALDYLQEYTQLSSDVKTISEAREMIRALQRKLY